MKVIRNRWIPFGSFAAINLFGVVWTKVELGKVERNHEYIHTLQQRELLFVGFYVIYLLEWLFHLVRQRNIIKAYASISFEREAYANQYNLNYRHQRRHFAWLSY